MQEALALEARGVTKRYSSAVVLRDMNFQLRKGEVHALLGANGAGKSTLLKILDGVVSDYEGELRVNGKRVEISSPQDAKRCGISMVHQELTVLPDITVAENIFLGRLPRTPFGTVRWNQLFEDARKALASIGLDIDPHMPLGKLVLADMQMVEIARILSMGAPILLLDEPTSALSEAEIQRLLKLILRLREEGRSVVFITHKLDEILAVCDRITIMRDGCLVDTVEVTDRGPEAEHRLVAMMIGDEKGDMGDLFPPRNTSAPGEVVLEAENLTREGVFREVSFQARRGEVVVFTGLKGAKRTELMRCVFGADAYTSGTVRIGGEELAAPTVRKAIARGVAMVTENRKEEGLVTMMSVRHNISLATIVDCSRFGWMSGQKIDRKAAKYIDQLFIKVPSPGVAAGALSGGNQQKVVLAKWMAVAPQILILDEPTRGIDVGAKREIYKLIRRMASEGATIVVVSSEIPEVIGLADRVYVMREGEMVGELRQGEIQDDVIMHMMFGHATTGSGGGSHGEDTEKTED